jgi:HEAT repeat protein
MVRLEAVTALGRRADGTDFSGYILKFLADRNIEVRSAASQAAGWLALTPAFDPLARLLDDPDADVRRHALRAMGRIDPLRAAAHPAVSRLAADLDPKVRAIADDLLTP